MQYSICTIFLQQRVKLQANPVSSAPTIEIKFQEAEIHLWYKTEAAVLLSFWAKKSKVHGFLGIFPCLERVALSKRYIEFKMWRVKTRKKTLLMFSNHAFCTGVPLCSFQQLYKDNFKKHHTQGKGTSSRRQFQCLEQLLSVLLAVQHSIFCMKPTDTLQTCPGLGNTHL